MLYSHVLALGRINAATSISIAQALQLIGALLPAMFGELISAYWQAVASCGAAQMVAKQPESFGRAVIIPALVELTLFYLVSYDSLAWRSDSLVDLDKLRSVVFAEASGKLKRFYLLQKKR